jgi:hypothetical protein
MKVPSQEHQVYGRINLWSPKFNQIKLDKKSTLNSIYHMKAFININRWPKGQYKYYFNN